MESARSNQRPLSLVLVDVDFFKQYNDLYGHLQGDTCLTTLAQTLSLALVGPRDLVARYGGEEFILVLPDTDLAGAQRVAERCQRLIEKLAIAHAQSPHGQRVTISLGVGTAVPGEGMAPTELMQTVDRLLYQAKQNGRNRIEPGR
jgi:diguanylate cyclase (GGDEF)-like protein